MICKHAFANTACEDRARQARDAADIVVADTGFSDWYFADRYPAYSAVA